MLRIIIILILESLGFQQNRDDNDGKVRLGRVEPKQSKKRRPLVNEYNLKIILIILLFFLMILLIFQFTPVIESGVMRNFMNNGV